MEFSPELKPNKWDEGKKPKCWINKIAIWRDATNNSAHCSSSCAETLPEFHLFESWNFHANPDYLLEYGKNRMEHVLVAIMNVFVCFHIACCSNATDQLACTTIAYHCYLTLALWVYAVFGKILILSLRIRLQPAENGLWNTYSINNGLLMRAGLCGKCENVWTLFSVRQLPYYVDFGQDRFKCQWQ